MTVDENGNISHKHEMSLKSEWSLFKLIRENKLFTYLDKELRDKFNTLAINNRI